MTQLGTLARIADRLRRPAPDPNLRTHKEWLHFCVQHADLDLLLNVSLSDDPHDPDLGEHARVAVLLRQGGAWRGEIETVPPSEVMAYPGPIHLRLGQTEVRFERGGWDIDVALSSGLLRGQLRLEPLTRPASVHNVRGLDGHPINWTVVPRCRCDGWLEIEGRRHPVHDGRAYHDHNWGAFAWGRNFAWEWGYALPEASPWTTVFARLNTRGHTRTLMQLLFFWRDDQLVRAFRDAEITVHRHGLLRARRVLKLPPVMGLIAPSLATDVPACIEVIARGWGDEATLRFTSRDVAQVILPNDHDLGVTIIHEVEGSVHAEGSVQGERFAFETTAVFEVLGA